MTKEIYSSLAVKAFAQMEGKKHEGAKPQTEYHVAKKAEYAKTAKLRELRLAKEAAEREAKQAETKPTPRKSAKRSTAVGDIPPKARRSISWGL